MSTESSTVGDLWDKLGDGLNAFQEGLGRFLMRLFGSSNERYVRKLGYIRARSADATHTVIPGSLLDQVTSSKSRCGR
jgi:preprotein translocase subunit SecA